MDKQQFSTIKSLAFHFAMESEARPFIEHFELVQQPSSFHPKIPSQHFFKRVGQLDLHVVLAGKDELHNVDYIGTEASVLAAYECMRTINPDLIVSSGTAGGFAEKGAYIGKIYLSETHFVYHDRHVPLDNFFDSAIGRYPSACTKYIAKQLDVDTGVISSGSSLKKSDSDISVIKSENAVAKEMEVASIAWIASLFNKPIIAIKSITNIVDEDNDSEVEFEKHFNKAVESLTKVSIDFIGLLVKE